MSIGQQETKLLSTIDKQVVYELDINQPEAFKQILANYLASAQSTRNQENLRLVTDNDQVYAGVSQSDNSFLRSVQAKNKEFGIVASAEISINNGKIEVFISQLFNDGKVENFRANLKPIFDLIYRTLDQLNLMRASIVIYPSSNFLEHIEFDLEEVYGFEKFVGEFQKNPNKFRIWMG